MSTEIRMIKPLFVNGSFNHEGKRMRAQHIKTVTHEGTDFSLWQSPGVAQKEHPKAKDDEKYIYVQVGDYLVNTGSSEFDFENRIGYIGMVAEMYGTEEARSEYFSSLREGRSWEDTDKAITNRLKEENEIIEKHKQNDNILGAEIKAMIDREVNAYIDARDNDGRYVSFVGAAHLAEIDKCLELSIVSRKAREREQAFRRAEREEREREEAEERTREEAKEIEVAESIFKNGGKIDSGEMIVKLCDKHGVEIPLRTRGWILNTFAECTVKDGKISGVRFYKRKGGNGSSRIWDILRDLQNVIVNVEWIDNILYGGEDEVLHGESA